MYVSLTFVGKILVTSKNTSYFSRQERPFRKKYKLVEREFTSASSKFSSKFSSKNTRQELSNYIIFARHD